MRNPLSAPYLRHLYNLSLLSSAPMSGVLQPTWLRQRIGNRFTPMYRDCQQISLTCLYRGQKMKNRRRLIIILTYATAVFLAAKAQSNAGALTTQITLAALYLGPAVILHFGINWIWGDDTPQTEEQD